MPSSFKAPCSLWRVFAVVAKTSTFPQPSSRYAQPAALSCSGCGRWGRSFCAGTWEHSFFAHRVRKGLSIGLQGRQFERRVRKNGGAGYPAPPFSGHCGCLPPVFTPPRRTASCTGRRRSRPGRAARRACPSRRYRRRESPGSRRRCGSSTGDAR